MVTKRSYRKLPFLAVDSFLHQVKVETLPLVLPAAEIQTVAGFHPPEVQWWGRRLLHQSNVQSDQRPFGKFLDFHGFVEIQFYLDLLFKAYIHKIVTQVSTYF